MITLSKLSPMGYTNGSIIITENHIQLYSYLEKDYKNWNINNNYDISQRNSENVTEMDIKFANEQEVWLKTMVHIKLFHQNFDKSKLTVLVMGCPHSGKSYLLYGSSWYHGRGIIPRYVQFLYSEAFTIGDQTDSSYRFYIRKPQVQLKMYILYKEDMIDLLDPPKLYKGGKHGANNLFISKSLGPILMPLKIIIATNIQTLLSEISTALASASVILSNCNELVSSATVVTSFQIFSPTLDIMQNVEFIELAATYFHIDNNTLSDLCGEIGTTINYSKDMFTGKSDSNWSVSTLYNEFEEFKSFSSHNLVNTINKTNECDKVMSEEGEDDNENICFDKNQSLNESCNKYSIDFHKSILTYVLNGSVTNTHNTKSCISIACLKGNSSSYQENSACLNLINNLQTYYNSSNNSNSSSEFNQTSKSNNNSMITQKKSSNLKQISQNCKEEVIMLNESIELEHVYILTLKDKIAKSSLIYGSMKSSSKINKIENSDEVLNKSSLIKAANRIQIFLQRVKYLDTFIKSIEDMRKFNQDKEEEARSNLEPKEIALPEPSKTSSKKTKSLIEQLKMDTMAPLIDDYDYDKPLAEVVASTVRKDLCPNDFLRNYGLIERIDTRNNPDHIDLHQESNSSLNKEQIEISKNIVPDIPWQQSDDPFSFKLPYLLMLSPYNMSSSYAKIPLALGFTVLKRTRLSVVEISELPKVSLDLFFNATTHDESEKKETNSVHQLFTTKEFDVLCNENNNNNLYNINIIKSSRIISLKKETVAYKEQLNNLSVNGTIPNNIFTAFTNPKDNKISTKENIKTSSKKTKNNLKNKKKSTNEADPEDTFKDILFNIDSSCVDDSILDGLCILGLIVRKFDSVSLIPTRSLLQDICDGKKKNIRPIFKINGKAIREAGEYCRSGIELYDRDIIQIGSNRWMQYRVPSTNAAYKIHPDTDLINTPEILSSLNIWETALYISYYKNLRDEITIQCLRKKCQIAHFKVNREINSIAKTIERSNLMKLQSFTPEWSEVDLFLNYIHIYDKFKIIECIICTNYATLIASEFRRSLVFTCILRPSILWNMIEYDEDTLFCTQKINRVWKSYREILLVLCYEDTNIPIDEHNHHSDFPKDKEQTAFSNINSGAWLWNNDIFKSRFLFMLDMITYFTDERHGRRDLAILSLKYPPEKDAFKPEILPDELVGNGFLCINRIEFLLDHEDTIRIIGYNGHPVGTIKIFIRSWIDKVESNPPYITAYVIPKLSDFINHTLIVHFYIEYISGLPVNHCADSFISFKFLGQLSVYRTPRCAGCTTQPYIDSIVEITKPINQSLIDYIRSATIQFKVFAGRKPSSKYITPNIRDLAEMTLLNNLVDPEVYEYEEEHFQSMKEANVVLKSRKITKSIKNDENISLKVKENTKETIKLPLVIEKVIVKVDNNSCCFCIIQ